MKIFKMGFRKTAVNSIALLAILIVSSASVPIDKNSTITTEILESREEKLARYRLPNNTIPRLYNIHIEPNMNVENFTWNGKTTIDIAIMDPTRLVTLHAANNLVIQENFTELVDTNGTKLTPVKHNRDHEVEFLKLEFDQEIPVGNYSLSLKYEATDTGNFVGFFMSPKALTGTPRVAGTQFEPSYARCAFPSWDEPALKARFRVSIKHFSNYSAISNMPEIEHVETSDGKILTIFDTTPIMSSYLVNFVISNYQNVFNEYQNVSLHTSNRSLEAARYMLELSPKVVEVMESYMGFPFGFPRIGSVLLPVYSATAIEHWGLITYSELIIRVYATSGTTSKKDLAEMMVAHELSHSWFGNRVSPLWWDDIWLSEAFSTYFQYYIMDMIYDNWGGVELFVLVNNQESAFPGDDDDAFPVKWTPITSTEILQMAGTMTYRKGSAIVHMFRNVLSDNVFRAGIQKFMAKYSFKAAAAEDLMAAFQEAYDEGPNKDKSLNVQATMTPWLVQTGYPIVNVTRNYTTGDTEVSQKSTLIINSTNKWWVPLTYTTKSSLNFSSTLPIVWISDQEDRVKIDGIDKDDWIVLNVQASGYYRVNYDDENWNRLADYLNTDNYTNIHVLNRAQLISDAFFIAQREPDRYYRNFYKLTKYLSREVEYLPWRSAYNAIEFIENSLRYTELHKTFVRYVLELMNSFIEKVGFEIRDTDDHFTILSRSSIIDWACVSGHSGCSEYAAQKLIKLAEDPVKNQLHPDTRTWTFCAGLKGLNDTAAKEFVAWAYEHERSALIESVACTENHEIQRNILNVSLSEVSTDHEYEIRTLFRTLLKGSKENFNTVVDYLLENHQAMNNSAAENGWFYTVAHIVVDILQAVKTRTSFERFKEILLLDAVLKDSKIPITVITEMAETRIAEGDASAALFLKLFDKQLSANNSTSDERIDPR